VPDHPFSILTFQSRQSTLSLPPIPGRIERTQLLPETVFFLERGPATGAKME